MLGTARFTYEKMQEEITSLPDKIPAHRSNEEEEYIRRRSAMIRDTRYAAYCIQALEDEGVGVDELKPMIGFGGDELYDTEWINGQLYAYARTHQLQVQSLLLDAFGTDCGHIIAAYVCDRLQRDLRPSEKQAWKKQRSE